MLKKLTYVRKCAQVECHYVRVPMPPEKSWNFCVKFPGPGKFWKVSLVLETPGNLNARFWKVPGKSWTLLGSDADVSCYLQLLYSRLLHTHYCGTAMKYVTIVLSPTLCKRYTVNIGF